MKCPHCSNELRYPDKAYFNAVTYLKPCTVVTQCCGNAIRIIPRVHLEVIAACVEKDDWGYPVIKNIVK